MRRYCKVEKKKVLKYYSTVKSFQIFGCCVTTRERKQCLQKTVKSSPEGGGAYAAHIDKTPPFPTSTSTQTLTVCVI